MFTHPSLAELSESALITQILGDPQWRGRILNITGFPDIANHFQGVPCSGLPGEPIGDIDILVVPEKSPEISIAIQAKRIKVSANTFLTGEPNKLNELGKLRQQAGLLADVGFSQTYCFVFVVVDSRQNNRGAYRYDGLTAGLKTKIESIDLTAGLDDRVGMMRFEIVQPIDDRPLGAGTYSGRLCRMAQQLLQPPKVTEWVVQTTKRLRSAA